MEYKLTYWEKNIPITGFPPEVLQILKEYDPEQFKTRDQIQATNTFKYACDIWDQVSKDRRQAFREQWTGKKNCLTRWYKEEEAARPTVVTRGQDHIPREIFEQQPFDYYIKYCGKYADVLSLPASPTKSIREDERKEKVKPKLATLKPEDRPGYNDPVVKKFREWRARKNAGIEVEVSSDEEEYIPRYRRRHIDNPSPIKTAAQIFKEREEEAAQGLLGKDEVALAIQSREEDALKERAVTVPTPSTVNPGSSISQIRPNARVPVKRASTFTGLQRHQDRAPATRSQTELSTIAPNSRALPERTNTSRLHQRYEKEVASPRRGSDLSAVQAAPPSRYLHARDPGVRGWSHATDDSQLPKRWAAIKKFTADQARKSITIRSRSSENTSSSSEWNTSSVVEGSRLIVDAPKHEPAAAGPSIRTSKSTEEIPKPETKAQRPEVKTPKDFKRSLPARDISSTNIGDYDTSDPFVSTEKSQPFETVGISKHGRAYKYRSRSMETIQADIDKALKEHPKRHPGKRPNYRPMPDSPTHKPRRSTIATATPTTEPNVPQPVFKHDFKASPSEPNSPEAGPSQEPRAVTLRRICLETKNDPKTRTERITAYYRGIYPERSTPTISTPPVERRDFSAPDPESLEIPTADSIRDPPRWKYAVSNRDFLAPRTQRRAQKSTNQHETPASMSATSQAPSSREYVASIAEYMEPNPKHDSPETKQPASTRGFVAPNAENTQTSSKNDQLPGFHRTTRASTYTPAAYRGYVAVTADSTKPTLKHDSSASVNPNSNSKPAPHQGYVASSAKDRSLGHAPPQEPWSPHADESILNAAFHWAVPTPPSNRLNIASKREPTAPIDRNSKPMPARTPGYVAHSSEQIVSQSSLKREYVSPIHSEKLHRKSSTESLIPFPDYNEAQAVSKDTLSDANNDALRRVPARYADSGDRVKDEWDHIMDAKLRTIINAASKEDDTLNMWRDRSRRFSKTSSSDSSTPPNHPPQATKIQITISITWASLIQLLTMLMFTYISAEILMTSLFGMPVYDDSPHWAPGSPVFPYVLATKVLEWSGLAGTGEGGVGVWQWYECVMRDIVPDVVAGLDVIIFISLIILYLGICYGWCRTGRGDGSWWELYRYIF